MSIRATTCEYYIGPDSNFRSNMFFQTLHGLHTSLVKYLTSCDKLYQWHCRSATNFDCSIGSTAVFQLFPSRTLMWDDSRCTGGFVPRSYDDP